MAPRLLPVMKTLYRTIEEPPIRSMRRLTFFQNLWFDRTHAFPPSQITLHGPWSHLWLSRGWASGWSDLWSAWPGYHPQGPGILRGARKYSPELHSSHFSPKRLINGCWYAYIFYSCFSARSCEPWICITWNPWLSSSLDIIFLWHSSGLFSAQKMASLPVLLSSIIWWIPLLHLVEP